MDREAVLVSQAVAHGSEPLIISDEHVAVPEDVRFDVPPIELPGTLPRSVPIRGDRIPCLMEALDVSARQQVLPGERDVGEAGNLREADDTGPGEQTLDLLCKLTTELTTQVRE